MRSMTGYGHAAEEGRRYRVRVTVRSVNHRFLDVRTRTPPELQEHAAALEAVARKRLMRGRVEIGVKLTGRGLRAAPTLDVERAKAAYAELCRVRDELAPGEAVPLSLLSTVPDLLIGVTILLAYVLVTLTQLGVAGLDA